jgi:hypothetical protein
LSGEAEKKKMEDTVPLLGPKSVVLKNMGTRNCRPEITRLCAQSKVAMAEKTEPNKPWTSLPLQVSKEVEGLLSMAVFTEVGDGANTLF